MKKAVVVVLFPLLLSAQAAMAQEETLKVAVGAMLSPKETFSEYRRIVEYLGTKLGMKTELVQRKDYSQTDRLIREEEVQLAFICAGPYVRDCRDFGVELIAAPVVRGKAHYSCLIIVGKDSPYRSLKDLRGKSFAYTDPDSNTGCWVPKMMVARLGEDPDGFFSKIIYTYAHDNSIEAVSKGLVEGAGVDNLVLEYMKLKGYPAAAGVRVVDESEPFGMPPVVVPKGVDPGLKASARKALLEMHRDPEGKKLLDALFIDRFVVPSDREYDSVRRVGEYVKKKKGETKRK